MLDFRDVKTQETVRVALASIGKSDGKFAENKQFSMFQVIDPETRGPGSGDLYHFLDEWTNVGFLSLRSIDLTEEGDVELGGWYDCDITFAHRWLGPSSHLTSFSITNVS